MQLAIFKLIRPNIDSNKRKYENGKKGASFGKKGGRPKKDNPSQTRNVDVDDNVDDDVDANNTLSKEESVREEANKGFNSQSIKEQLLSDQTWKESVCIKSTFGVSFMSMLPDQIDKFIAYIVSIGEERSISNLSDAKRRFTYWWQNYGRKEVKDESRQEYIIPD